MNKLQFSYNYNWKQGWKTLSACYNYLKCTIIYKRENIKHSKQSLNELNLRKDKNWQQIGTTEYKFQRKSLLKH